MVLKKFQGDSLPEVIDEIRATFGDKASIVSTSGDELSVIVMAEIASSDVSPIFREGSLHKHDDASDIDMFLESISSIKKTCLYHGIDQDVQEKWIEGIEMDHNNQIADKAFDTDFIDERIAQALRSVFSFDPFWVDELTPQRPFMLMGTPGSGKTVILAKLANMLLAKNKLVRLMSLGTKKAGASAQIKAYATEMSIPLYATSLDEIQKAPHSIRDIINESMRSEEIVLIDTPALNPLLETDKEDLLYIRSLFPHAFLGFVFPAGTDAQETRFLLNTLFLLRISALIISRVDCSLRLGSVLNACFDQKLPLAGFTSSSCFMSPIKILSASALAHQLIFMQKERGGALK